MWDDITGQTVIDDLEIKEGNVIRSDLSGETIAILDRTGQVWIWRLPLPKTDAERCDLVEISERAGGYGLNENDIPVAIENLNSLGRVYSEQCDVLKYRPSSSLHDWISESYDNQRVGPEMQLRLKLTHEIYLGWSLVI